MDYSVVWETSRKQWYIKGFEREQGYWFDSQGDAVERALELTRNSGGECVHVYHKGDGKGIAAKIHV